MPKNNIPDFVKKDALVNYHSIKGRPASLTGKRILSEPWDLCGHMMVKIEGKAGGVSVEHLTEYVSESA